MIKVKQIKKDFPIFTNIPKLIYLDSAATSLKPIQVIRKENEYYTKYSANIFRGIYKISEKATVEYESVRKKVAQFIGSKNEQEIIFVRNTTEAINLVATSLTGTLNKDDEIITSIMEHHSNFVPWQNLHLITGCKFHIVKATKDGLLDLNHLISLVNNKTKIVALSHISNVLGTINPIKAITKLIKNINPKCLILIDGAQAIPNLSIDVADSGCDFYAFSSHKILGPTGVGILWGRYNLLNTLSPYQYGGEMINAVYVDHTEYKHPPHKFEAGTPNIAGIIGLGAAIDYLQNLGMNEIREHEMELVSYALGKLKQIKGITVYGPKKIEDRGGVISFTIDKVHAHDIAQILDSNNICIRSGHHCAMPLHKSLNISSTARATFYLYNSLEDVDALIKGLYKVKKIFS